MVPGSTEGNRQPLRGAARRAGGAACARSHPYSGIGSSDGAGRGRAWQGGGDRTPVLIRPRSANIATLKQSGMPLAVGFSPMQRCPPNHPQDHRVAELDDPFRVSVAAAEMGTWDWDIPSGRVRWTPQMYLLFGIEAGRFTTTFENVMALIHPDDRPRVEAAVDRAARDLRRSVMEFRIRRPDGTVRWLRCSGRAFADARGKAIRMAGVAEDATQERGEATSPPPDVVQGSLSTRQVAQLLGMGEASVKRLANAGSIGFLRSSRKDSRRFAPEQVLEYLRKQAGEALDFEAALAAADLAGCVAALMEEVGRGASLDDVLDDRVLPAASSAPAPLLAELLARLPALVSEPRKSAPAFVTLFGRVNGCTAGLVACSLRGHGYSVLSPAESNDSGQLVDLVERVRARVVALIAGSEPPARTAAARIAASVAARLRGAVVAVHDAARTALARGVSRVRSMRDLGRLLHG
jgi:PAS domain-containing protein